MEKERNLQRVILLTSFRVLSCEGMMPCWWDLALFLGYSVSLESRLKLNA